MSFSFFGPVDRNKITKKVSSEYPAWMLFTHTEELRETIAQEERSIAAGRIPATELPEFRAQLKIKAERLEEVLKSRPKLTAKQIENIEKAYKEVSSKIADALFTHSEMKMGTADAHEEARRMSEYIINIECIDVAKACNVEPTIDNRVTRKGAEKVFKIVGAYMGAPTNSETLRKDTRTV